MTMLRQADCTTRRPLAAIGRGIADERRNKPDEQVEPAHRERRAERAILAIFIEAASALITQFVEVGISDHADIARRLNRRGFPCWGRARWTAGAVAKVMRHKARLDESL
jgi:hypothetical protein